MRTTRPGFTLVEILAVVVILGLSAAVIVPQLGSRDDLRGSSMARVVTADLLFAQNRAVTMQKMQYVRFDPAGGTYEVLDSIDPDVPVTHPVHKGVFRVQVGAARGDDLKGVTLTSASFDGEAVLAFDELGTPHAYDPVAESASTMTAGSIVLTAGQNTRTITIEPFSGEIKVN